MLAFTLLFCTQGVVMLMAGFPLTGALGLMMPYVPAPVMEALAFILLVSGAVEMSAHMPQVVLRCCRLGRASLVW
jgi:hypothetical protein